MGNLLKKYKKPINLNNCNDGTVELASMAQG